MAAKEKNPTIIAELMASHVPAPWCDEWEKMVSGMEFDVDNSQLMVSFKWALNEKWQSLNDDAFLAEDTLATLNARRMAAAKTIFGNIGADSFIEPCISINWGCNTFIGDRVYINRCACIYDNTIIKIGDGTLIGPNVILCTATPYIGMRGYHEAKDIPYAKPIIIESDCWIGARAMVMPGVTIGRGSTVAAGALVTEDVAPETLVGGRPAKFIKKIG